MDRTLEFLLHDEWLRRNAGATLYGVGEVTEIVSSSSKEVVAPDCDRRRASDCAPDVMCFVLSNVWRVTCGAVRKTNQRRPDCRRTSR